MPTALTGDEQIQQLTMTVKSDEKDGLIFYVADDPVCYTYWQSNLSWYGKISK